MQRNLEDQQKKIKEMETEMEKLKT